MLKQVVAEGRPFVTKIGNEMLTQIPLGPVAMVMLGETQGKLIGDILDGRAVGLLDMIDGRDCRGAQITERFPLEEEARKRNLDFFSDRGGHDRIS